MINTMSRTLNPIFALKGMLGNWNKFANNLPDTKYFGVPYGNKALLVARVPYDDGYAEIPLMVMPPMNLGEYNGKITKVRDASFKRKDGGPDRSVMSLNQDGFFKLHEQMIVTAADQTKEDLRGND